MQGASITLLKCDEEILKNWDAPVHTAAMRWGIVKSNLLFLINFRIRKTLFKIKYE